MDSKDEIVFKIPTISATKVEPKQTNDSISGQTLAEESATEEVTAEHKTDGESEPNVVLNETNVLKTVLPEPMTRIDPPEDHYFVDQLKNGCIVNEKPVRKARLVFGRALDCDIVLEHPSVSRYHAVLLWSPVSDDDYRTGKNVDSFWYLVDCGSTHGTQCNKAPVVVGKLIKLIPNNNVFRLGASTRLFTLRSTVEDLEDEDRDDVEQQQSSVESKVKNKTENVDNGCSWGINEEELDETVEESVDSKSLQAIIAAMKSTGSEALETDNSNAYSANPNKSIQQWFEREGYELEFKCDSIHNKFKCTLDLPIDGQWIPVEGSLLHKKKEAITDACLKCCQLLDRAELLFPWQQQQKAQAKRRQNEEDLDSDSDMIDETIPIRPKKLRKDSESNDNSAKVETFDTLNQKWSEMAEELCQMKAKLARIGAQNDEQSRDSGQEMLDPLDDYMASIGKQKTYGLSISDKIEKSNLKMKINLLVKEQQKLEKLINLAKPSVQFQTVFGEKEEKSLKTEEKSLKTEEKSLKTEEKSLKIEEKSLKIEEKSLKIEEKSLKSEGSDSKSEEKKIDFKIPVIESKVQIREPIVESNSEPMDETEKMKEIVKQKTETIINELKKSVSKPKSSDSKFAKTHKIKAQSIVEAIEKEKQLEKSKVKAGYDDDYVDWLPPSDQAGDGKTALNDRFGY